MVMNMAGRKTCFRLLASGLLLTIAVFILIGIKAWQPRFQVLLDQAWTRNAVSLTYRSTLPRKTVNNGVNKSEVQNIRELILEHFNPDTDLTVKKSEVKIGQLIRYETSRTQYANITKHFYRLIPETSPLLGKHFRSCALVGNSGILLGSRCGPQIDSADFVIRCNLAPIEGFETDVGTKSNFTTMNPSVLPHDYKGHLGNISVRESFVHRLRLIGDEILYIPALVTANGRDDVEFTNKLIVERHLPIKVTYAPRGTNGKMTSLWKKLKFKVKRPSTGAVLFALVACICDQTHLYGFYPFPKDYQGRQIKYHYYGGNSKAYGLHNMSEEFRAYQMLHQRKALVLHTEPCTDGNMKEK